MTADIGTTEDLVGQRRAMMDMLSPEEAEEFQKTMNELIEHEREHSWDGLSWNEDSSVVDVTGDSQVDDGIDRNQKAHGPWSETIVRVDRVQKTQRGGTKVRYRAMVIGGNLNGCAGFGVAKANAPNEASAAAARVAKRNIFFIDRYNGSGLTSDLAGKHNSCVVALRSVNPNRGLHGHPLVCEIMKYFGITDCTAKSHGNRNIYNVVRATFKAIMTHESLEDIALKRGKRLMNLERAKRLQI
jgi:small subunit ribosomal protein S5